MDSNYSKKYLTGMLYQKINLRKFLFIAFYYFILLIWILPAFASETAYCTGKSDNELPFDMPDLPVPEFLDHCVNISDFGAVGDGLVMNTNAFAEAIKVCADSGGGKVIVPEGIWLTGPIQLQSNINLHLQKNAIIIFSDRYDDYPLIQSNWEGTHAVRCMPPIFGKNLKNIAITGEGIIDGSGQAWRPVKKFKMTERQWHDLVASGGVLNQEGDIWWPSESALNGPLRIAELQRSGNTKEEDYKAVRAYLRPVLIGLVQCENILFDGPTFQNSPAWNIHPLMCKKMIIRNIKVRNPWYSQNGDGIDLESCCDVLLFNNTFDVGDDAICIKSGKDKEGRNRGIPTERVLIDGCTVFHGHGGFTIGSEMSGDVRNIVVRNCTFFGTDVGLRFKSKRGRGGIVENIYLENIFMKDIPTDAIRFNMYYESQAPIPDDGSMDLAGSQVERTYVPAGEETPCFRKIFLKNIVCRGAERAILLQGLPEMPIRDIELENIRISSNIGFSCIDAKHIILKQVEIISKYEPVFSFDNSKNVIMENVMLDKARSTLIQLKGSDTDQILMKGENNADMFSKIEFREGAEAAAVRFE